MCFITDPTFSFFCSCFKNRRFFYDSPVAPVMLSGSRNGESLFFIQKPPCFLRIFSGKQNTSASVPKSSHFLFNSSSPATVQKPVNFIRHICGLGASVGCERVERTFNTQRLKAQICLMKFTGFVCSLSNELNSKTSFYSTMQMFVF